MSSRSSHGSAELLQVQQDGDKIVMLGLFGTPGCTHEDDAARASRAACEIPPAVADGRRSASVGVASGPALCGVYGNECRQEYTVLGNVMNLAARLMQRQEGVLCDAATARRAGASLEWSDGGSVALKGFARQVPVARLQAWRSA